jgi:hypothetical protein
MPWTSQPLETSCAARLFPAMPVTPAMRARNVRGLSSFEDARSNLQAAEAGHAHRETRPAAARSAGRSSFDAPLPSSRGGGMAAGTSREWTAGSTRWSAVSPATAGRGRGAAPPVVDGLVRAGRHRRRTWAVDDECPHRPPRRGPSRAPAS